MSLNSLRMFLLALTFAHLASYNAQIIQSSDGENVYCVDRKTQPAFDNPLLKNHKFQEWPSEIPRIIGASQKGKKRTLEANASSAKCPEGTVPIRNGTVHHQTKLDPKDYTPGHEYATISTNTPPKIYGTKATINVWDPAIEEGANEMSISQIWLSAGEYESGDLNPIEVGWQVLPDMYKDNKPRLFLFWTSNAYKTGCYNVRCLVPGFIQTSSNVVIGGPITPISSIGGRQFEITIHVWKSSGRHRTTQMGSGHFPDEGFRTSSYFRNVEIVDNNNSLQSVQNSTRTITNPEFYNLKDLYTEEWNTHLFYGGPGFRPTNSRAVRSSAWNSIFGYFLLCFLVII